MSRVGRPPRLFVFCYHKSGTQLFDKILSELAVHFSLTMGKFLGVVDQVDDAVDVALFCHSLITFDLGDYPHRGVRIIRDPRGIWLSGYWYHRRCPERWCVNASFDATPPIGFPQVPYSQVHRPEVWKRDYMAGLGGRSYQANLLALDLDAGLAFEEERYAAWTAEAMAGWQPHDDTIDVNLEAIAADFDATMAMIFDHFGFTGERLARAMRISRSHDVARMSDTAVSANPHITSRDVRLWERQLSPDRRRRFEIRHRSLISALGYPI